MNLLDYVFDALCILVVFDCIASIFGAKGCTRFWAGDRATTVRSPSSFEY